MFWNTDAWRYSEETPALYQTHPWIMAVLPSGQTIGILADCIRRGQAIAAVDGVEFAFEGGPFDVYTFECDEPLACSRVLAELTGTMPLPPRWALGYHQCRWGYETEDEVLRIAEEFRSLELPVDAIWLDIEHMDRHRVFSFNPERFSDPEGMTDRLHELGLKVVTILDPGVVVDKADPIYRSGKEGHHFVVDKNGEDAIGRVWPGRCHFPDFASARTRAWWAEQVEAWVLRGIDGLWNDMNEPAAGRTPTKTLPDDCQQGDQKDLEHKDVHNAYGYWMTEASRDGLRRAHPNRRPFVLSRSSVLGGQRQAAVWTGDNQATWTDLRWSLSMTLSLGLSGQPFAGADVGGFDGDPTPELFVRWFELGAWLPFFRGHSSITACHKEPWSFGPDALRILHGILRRRLEFLPVWATVMAEASRSGTPAVRPLFFDNPDDPALRTIDYAFLVGSDLLVAPIVKEGANERSIHLPPGLWYRLPMAANADLPAGALRGEVQVAAELGSTPIFARAGSIIPTYAIDNETSTVRNTDDAARSPLRLLVFPDERGHASGSLYEDEGDGNGHQESGFRLAHYSASQNDSGTLTVDAAFEGDFRPANRALEVVVFPAGSSSAGFGSAGFGPNRSKFPAESFPIRLPPA